MVQNGHVTSPVSFSDANTAIGAKHTDLAALCKDDNINMWSVGKPVFNTKVGILTDSDLKTGHTVSGYDIAYGIKKRASATLSDYINTTTGVVVSAPWTYDKPASGSAYRLHDFNNYWHSAQCAMYIELTSKDKISVPSTSSQAGEALQNMVNFRYWLYNEGAISSQQLFGNISSYHPSIIMTCYYSGGAWTYVKSAPKEGGGYLTIGEIGASSSQSGAEINFTTKDLADAMVNDGAQYGTDCFLNGREWTICLVLLSGNGVAGTAGDHSIGGRTIVRLEYLTGLDRKTLTITNYKYNYITSMSMVITITKDGNNYKITSIVVTAVKATSDAINFTVDATFQCPYGNVGVSGVTADAPSISVSGYSSANYPASSGSKNVTLAYNTTTYKPSGTDPSSGEKVCAGTLTFKNNTYGNWSGSFNFNVASGTSSYTKTITLI